MNERPKPSAEDALSDDDAEGATASWLGCLGLLIVVPLALYGVLSTPRLIDRWLGDRTVAISYDEDGIYERGHAENDVVCVGGLPVLVSPEASERATPAGRDPFDACEEQQEEFAGRTRTLAIGTGVGWAAVFILFWNFRRDVQSWLARRW